MTAEEILQRAARRGGEALAELLPALAEGRVDLAALIARPRLLSDLDACSRRAVWLPAPIRQPEAYFLQSPSPLTAALASMSRDGRIRERAVAVLAESPEPGLIPFIVLRCGDWAAQVRGPARSVLSAVLAADLARFLPAALPMAAYTAARGRGGWAMTHLRRRVTEAFDDIGPALMRSRSPRERRLAFEVGVSLRRWIYDDLVGWARREKDPFIRRLSLDGVIATADVDVLRSLVRSRFSGVRATALVGLAKLGLDAEVAALMDDPTPLVRAYARSRATDPLAHYRAAVAADPTPATVAALGEVGHYADAALLTPLLAHGDAQIRAAAVRALAAVDCLPVDAVTPLLRDPSPSVVREAAGALRGHRLPAAPWSLLTDPRPEVRRGAYRALAGGDLHARLRAALLLAADTDAGLARRGHADADRLVRYGLARIGDPSSLSAGDRAELAGLAARLSPYLADGIRALP
ncbi:HEAT repeat domain-containing protein [Actinoplanes sp. NPDC049596]|uniref:HEAT repeat domain-containing protein n=1 Tax=unclassified Actinoplanes TaxID=2626549 RepID=UPI003440CAF1